MHLQENTLVGIPAPTFSLGIIETKDLRSLKVVPSMLASKKNLLLSCHLKVNFIHKKPGPMKTI
jgi:hypothetical protein